MPPEGTSAFSRQDTLLRLPVVVFDVVDPESEKSSSRDELRTIAFRLREIQRLLAVHVAQQNRRLEADGLQPVTDEDAFTEYERSGRSRE